MIEENAELYEKAGRIDEVPDPMSESTQVTELKKNTSISIITAVYNGASTISDCLNSVCSQSMPVEHLIIDGASTDNTLEIVRKVNPCARIVSEPDNGIYDAMNKGIRLAAGDIVGILNADDFYATTDVLADIAAIFADPTVDACYGDLEYVTERKGMETGDRETPERVNDNSQDLPFASYRSRFAVVRYWRSGAFDARKFYWGWMPPHPAFFVRRSVYERYGFFNLNLGSAADYELILRLLLTHRVSTVYLPGVLVKMRAGGVSNVSLKNRLRANQMDRKAWQINNLKPFPWTLSMKPLRKIIQYIVREP